MDELIFKFKEKKNLPLILQNETAECGHACAVMICNYFGHNLDIFALKKMYPTSVNGINLLEITQLLNSLTIKNTCSKIRNR